jgi:hypothetical protein
LYSKKNLKNVALKYVEKLVKLLAGQKFSFNVAKERIPKKREVTLSLIKMETQFMSARLTKEIYVKEF